MIVSTYLGINTPFDIFFPAYTLENILFLQDGALLPVNKDGEISQFNYLYNIYSTLFSLWVHRSLLLIQKIGFFKTFYNISFYLLGFELYSISMGIAAIAPSYWGVGIVLVLLPITAAIMIGIGLLMNKLNFDLYELEVNPKDLTSGSLLRRLNQV